MAARHLHDLAMVGLVAAALGGCAAVLGLSNFTAVDDLPDSGPGDVGAVNGPAVDGALEGGPSTCPDAPQSGGTFAVDTDLSTSSSAGRSCADGGDAVAYSVVAMTAKTATLDRAPAAGCLLPCDQVLVLDLQGTAGHDVNVGQHEALRVASVDGNVVTFESPKTKFFGNGESDDTNLGMEATNQRVTLQRVPLYADVTVKEGVTLTSKPWNGVLGGVLYLRSAGAIDITGVVSMDRAGFRGGVTSGAGPEDSAGLTTVGGGNGGNAAATGPGGDGAGAPATGGGSGGTNGCSGGYPAGVGYIGGGGGAGNAGDCAAGAGPGGGAPYTVAAAGTPKDFSRWLLGGGGSAGAGGGTRGNQTGGTPNGGAPGAAGGGIIYLEGRSLTLGSARRVTSAGGNGGNGADGETSGGDSGGGGGGGGGQGAAGGTIVLVGDTVTFVDGAVVAPGGNGGNGGNGGAGGATGGPGPGGAGGQGAAFATGNDVGGNGGAGGSANFGDGGGGGRGGSSGPSGAMQILQGGVVVPNR